MAHFVHILASRKHSTLYIGVTNDLVRRVHEHRTHAVPGFTQKHDVTKLVYFESSDSIEGAIQREKMLKNWNRDWKIQLIEGNNPEWIDLFESL